MSALYKKKLLPELKYVFPIFPLMYILLKECVFLCYFLFFMNLNCLLFNEFSLFFIVFKYNDEASLNGILIILGLSQNIHDIKVYNSMFSIDKS